MVYFSVEDALVYLRDASKQLISYRRTTECAEHSRVFAFAPLHS